MSREYAPIPDEPRYRKKSKKVHVKSNHKHEYETVCVDAHSFVFKHGGKVPYMHMATRCRVCGRIGDVQIRNDLAEPPEGMPMYEVPDWAYLCAGKTLPEEMEIKR